METTAASIQELRVGPFKAFRLENNLVQADILPELGGKIWTLLHKPTNNQWLWHNPGVPLQTPAPGAAYDECWAGGWEELFPNDAPGVFQGRDLPDHGEWWSRSWKAEVAAPSDRRASLKLALEGRAVKARCEKWVSLDGSTLTVSYRITNLEPRTLHFLFKQHVALAVTPDHRLELPGGKMEPVDLGFSARLGSAGPFDWPTGRGPAGQSVDLSVLPPESQQLREFIYVSDLPEGSCGARHKPSGARLRLRFERAVFPHTWLFMTFGGWRGLYTVVLEPCTNKPKDLGEALRLGRCASLAPQKSLECAVSAELS